VTTNSDDSEADLERLVRRTAETTIGVAVAEVQALAGQLGVRRFYRVRFESGSIASLIARVEQPEDPAGRPANMAPEPTLEPIRALLERHGLPVPARFGGDDSAGIDLLEDLGSQSLQQLATSATSEELCALYSEACDLVPKLQAIADPGLGVAAFSRKLDATLFAYKADLFARWALQGRPQPATPAERKLVEAAFERVARESLCAPHRLAHRDFQSANLHRVSARGLVMIDLQGAFLAPPEYDLVCLLRDSYVSLPEELVAQQLQRVRRSLPDAPPPEEFARRFDLLTLTRKGKDLARFRFAAEERGDERFLAYVPHTVRVLRDAAKRSADRDPGLRDFSDLCETLAESPCAR